MLLALVFGIAFSSLSVSKGVKLGSQYRGSFQAVVGVYDVNEKENETKGLPNGDAKKGANILQDKMSPFADGSINITIDGKSRLIVTAPRDSYGNNQQLFVNAIQATGGLFIFDQDNKDVMLSESLMKKAGLDGKIAAKSPTSALLGEVAAISKKEGLTNRPYVQFKLVEDKLKKIIAPESEGQKAPKLSMVIDTTTILDTVRNYFLFAANDTNDKTLDTYLETFIDVFIKPLYDKLKDNKDKLSEDQIAVLEDFWTINHWTETTNGDWQQETNSLANTNFIADYLASNSVAKFKKLFFADGNADHIFKYKNDVTKYAYDSNSKGEDFAEGGRYGTKLDIDGKKIGVDVAFNTLTNTLLPLVNKDGKITDKLDAKLFNEHFLFAGEIAENDKPATQQSGNIAYINGQDLLISAGTNTYAKKAAAQISQTGSGYSFHVLSTTSVDPIISNIMFIFSLVILIIIAIVIAIFMLFFYRLLGLFTIIIAAIIASLTIMMNVVFGIAMGPDILAIMFVIIGMVMDLSIVLFEAFKNNIYRDKRPITSAFKISNRETLWLVVDVCLAALLPNIVLFWIGIGFLNNFATILTMGIFFTLAFGVVVLRLLIYFTIKTPILKKHEWLLPIDTSLDYRGSFFKNYMIDFYEERLDTYSLKNELSTKDLLKIKKTEQKITALKASNEKLILKRESKEVLRREKQAKKWTKRLNHARDKASYWNQKVHWWASPFQNYYKNRVDNYIFLLSTVTPKIIMEESHEESLETSGQMLDNRLAKIERSTGRVGWITLFFTGLFGCIALGFMLTIGLNYSPNFGKGTQYYIYGTYITDTYDILGAPDTIEGINSAPEADKNKIIENLNNISIKSKESVLQKHNWTDPNKNPPEEYQHEWQALGVYESYRFMISNGYMKYLTTRVANVDFKDVKYAFGTNYAMIDPTTGTFESRPWVSITVTNNLIPSNNAIKEAFQAFAGHSSGTSKPQPPKNEYGVVGTSLQPHTADAQMRQIGLTFLIVLLALLIYMIIRFKWTYYVALALGLVITLVLTLSLVIVLRIPFTIEALAGVLGVLEFALITGMLLLGKGKSLIISKNETTLARYFEEEIRLQASKQEARQNYKKTLKNLKVANHESRLALEKTIPEYKANLKALKAEQRKAFKIAKRTGRENYDLIIQNINVAIRQEALKNNFLKEIFVEVLRFGILRTIFIGLFYFIIALVLTITLPPIAIMGFTLMVGVIVTTIVMLTIMLPIWLRLEGRRIRWKYGYKRFVNKLKVNREEQVVTGLND